MRNLLLLVIGCLVALPGLAQEPPGSSPAHAMNDKELGGLIKRLDPDMAGPAGGWQFIVEQRPLMVITDARANRMRIMSPVAESDEVSVEQLQRLMPANFDSALNARYAIANGKVWSLFLHPLRSLSEKQFFSAVAQVVNLVETFGESYASGAIMFGGGDSKVIEQQRYQRIVDRANAI